ncbi:MAG: two-component system sensor histidine kinase NtrB [Spirochaetia bacterium]
MRSFLQKALEKLDRLDREQIRSLVTHITSENELLGMVLESMTDGVIVTDKENKLLFVNKSAERLLPFTYQETQEDEVWNYIDDGELSSFFKETLAEQSRINDREFTLQNEGVPQTLSISIMPLVSEGNIQGNLFHIEDVTDKRSKEARLRRAESLAALTTLTAGVAHEIKNPLGSISIHLQLIEKAMKKMEVESDEISHYFEIVNEEVDRLNRIVVDFLFAVRPMDIQTQDSCINYLIHDLIDFLQFELEEADIDISLKLSDKLPYIEIDEKYIKQALLNIIKNAVSAMEEGGTLTIATRVKNNDVVLCISDTGRGIQEEHLSKIFEPYFTTKDFGSGLGLTLVYKIIKEHKGEISVNSKPGEGTTFTIKFPIPQREKHLLGWRGGE